MLGAVGFVCYVGLQKQFGGPDGIVEMSWFRNSRMLQLRDLDHAEEILSRRYSSKIWKTHLPGHRHDYYFYSRIQPEEILELIEVAKVMVS